MSVPFARSLFTVAMCSAALAGACGGGQPAPEAPPTEPALEAPEPAAPAEEELAEAEPSAPAEEPIPEGPWTDMSEEQRQTYMKKVVMPEMSTLLTGFDPEEFPKVNCVTCHGEGAKEGKFEMPNPKLHKLDPANSFAADRKAHPEMTQFMMDKVVPKMAELLKLEPYDPKTQKGFGCFNCHTTKGK